MTVTSYVDDLRRYGATTIDLELGLVIEGHPVFERYYAIEMKHVRAKPSHCGEFHHELTFQSQLISDYYDAVNSERGATLDLTIVCRDSHENKQLTWRALMNKYSRSLWVIAER